MKLLTKKLLSLALSAALVFSALPLNVLAENPTAPISPEAPAEITDGKSAEQQGEAQLQCNCSFLCTEETTVTMQL